MALLICDECGNVKSRCTCTSGGLSSGGGISNLQINQSMKMLPFIIVGAFLFSIYLVVVNLFSVVTIFQYGPLQWGANIKHFHHDMYAYVHYTDTVYPSVMDRLEITPESLKANNVKTYVLPANHNVELRGYRVNDLGTFVAVRYYDNGEQIRGYILLRGVDPGFNWSRMKWGSYWTQIEIDNFKHFYPDKDGDALEQAVLSRN